MQVLKKSNSGIQSLNINSVLLSQRKIFLSGTINMESVNDIIQQLVFLESEDANTPIHIYISSPGGEVNAGLLIYDQLKGMSLPVKLYCMGTVASMAAIIFAGGKKGNRFMMPHSKIMLHEPLMSGGDSTQSASAIQRAAKSIENTKNVLINLLASDTGHTKKDIAKLMAEGDLWLDADDAIKFGICDAVINRV